MSVLASRAFRVAATAVLLTSLATACASPPRPATCAAVAGMLGGGATAYGVSEFEENDGWQAGSGVAGAVVFGTAGYYLCRALAKEEPAPPEPTPAPAVEPRVTQPIQPEPEPEPEPELAERIVLRGVNFDFDKSEIRPDAAVILDEAIRILADRPTVRIRVEGHTDWTGTEAYNQGLSERRAAAVKRYLVEHGIAADRLQTAGYGETRPVASNQTREGRALNRRVELRVVE